MVVGGLQGSGKLNSEHGARLKEGLLSTKPENVQVQMFARAPARTGVSPHHCIPLQTRENISLLVVRVTVGPLRSLVSLYQRSLQTTQWDLGWGPIHRG